jgi:hypothetical protein
MPAEGVVVVLGALTAASMLAFAPRWRGIAVPAMFAAVLVFGIAQASWIMPRAIAGISQGYPQVLQGVGEQPRDWVDRALPSGAEAAVLAGRLNSPDEQGQWLWTEFWNKRITQGVSRDGLSAYSGWPGIRLDVDAATGAAVAAGAPGHLVVGEHAPQVQLEGRVVARATPGLLLLETPRRLQARSLLEGADLNGRPTSSRPLRLHVYGARARRPVELDLLADAAVPGDPTHALSYEVAGRGPARRGEVPAGALRTIRVTPQDGVVDIGHGQGQASSGGTLSLQVTAVRLG